MKFPKSMHAEGWASHLEETKPEHLSDALKSAPSKPAVGAARFKPTGAGAKISIHAPLNATAAETPRVEPAYARPQVRPQVTPAPTTAIQRDRQISWMIPAGAGAAIIAAVAIWAMNRPSHDPVTPPALVVGSAEPQTEVAAATPAPEAPAASQAEDSTSTTVAAAPTTPVDATPTPTEPAPARLGLPVTTSRPAVEPRPVVAQAPAPTARPDMVLRSAPSVPAVATLPPPTTVAAAPTDSQPLSVPTGSAPIVMPPTAAGPATATTPQALPPATAPVAAATPDASASSVSPGMPPLTQTQPPLAQAQPQPAQPMQPVQALPEDSGITVKVRMALAADVTLSAVPIAVSTDHGVVKLEGQAPDSQTRERATVVASSAGGVKAVDNRLTLPPATVVSQAPVTQQ